MINYDKTEVREQLGIEHIFSLLQEWGGEPEYTNFGILSSTICHNPPGIGSRKLYYYSNSNLFTCYTGCEENFFDIFELYRKVSVIQKQKEIDLNEAIRTIAAKFGIAGEYTKDSDKEEIEDWSIFSGYDRIKEIETKKQGLISLKSYDDSILNNFNYKVKLEPWLNENISQEVLNLMRIGYYPGDAQITIPHVDEEGHLVGIRGRTLIKEEAELYGKYRPLRINQIMYNHPLGMNLYNYYYVKDNISRYKKAIVFESEKSTLKYKSYFGQENDISVACCGSNLSNYQVEMLLRAGAEEIIVAFDRQFQAIGDDEFKHLKRNLLKLKDKYMSYVLMSFIFDKNMITQYKNAPIDEGIDKFFTLFKERII